MIDFNEFEKQGKSMIQMLGQMQNSLTKNMDEVSNMEGAEIVKPKLDLLQKYFKAGDLAGIKRVQKDLLKMKAQAEKEQEKDER